MDWKSGRVLALRRDQFAPAQEIESGLDRAFGKTGFVGERAQTGGNWFPFRARSAAIKMKINEIGRGLTIVPDDVAHQDIENIIVYGNRFAKPGHDQSRREEGKIRKDKFSSYTDKRPIDFALFPRSQSLCLVAGDHRRCAASSSSWGPQTKTSPRDRRSEMRARLDWFPSGA